MSDSNRQQRPDPIQTLRSGGSAKLAAEQLVGLLQNGLQDEIECRLDWLNQRLDALASRLDGLLDDSSAVNAEGADAPGLSDDALTKRLKTVIGSVLVESGVLEELVRRVVRREIDSAGAGDAGGDSTDKIKAAAGSIVKDFLSEHLGEILRKEVAGVVEKQVHAVVGSDELKQLIDDKFRVVTMYLKTDVVPGAVRQALQSG